MQQQIVATEPKKPLWRRIVDFPLVTMLLAIALYAIATAAAIWIGNMVGPETQTISAAIRSAIAIGIVAIVYKTVIVHLGERPRDDLPAEGALKNLALGWLAGMMIFAVVVGIASAAGVYRIVGYGGTEQLAHDLIIIAIMPGFMEELFFRGILFRWIEEFGGSWAALLITSALFGLAHIFNPNATWFSSFAIAVEAGVLLGATYILTRSLWMPMALHAAWNFTQGFIFDVPVSGVQENGLVEAQLSGPEILSGGSFGLEASAIALVVATAVGVWFLVVAVRNGQLMQPRWVRRRLGQDHPLTETFA